MKQCEFVANIYRKNKKKSVLRKKKAIFCALNFPINYFFLAFKHQSIIMISKDAGQLFHLIHSVGIVSAHGKQKKKKVVYIFLLTS